MKHYFALSLLMSVSVSWAQSNLDGFAPTAPQNALVGTSDGWEFLKDESPVIHDDSLTQSSEVVTSEPPPPSYQTPPTRPQLKTPPLQRPTPPRVTRPQPMQRPPQASAGRYVGLAALPIVKNLIGRDSAIQIRGCGGTNTNVTFGSGANPRSCVNNELVMSSRFYPFVMTHLPRCVNEALRAVGKPTASNIHIQNMGTLSMRRARGGSEWSMHSTGRALDISGFNMTLANGQSMYIPMTVASRNHPFYNQFVNCWRRVVRAAQPACPRSSSGALDCRAPNHHDHVHLSLPFCPGLSGVSGT